MSAISHAYNIHDILTVQSAVTLPELTAFRIGDSVDNPTIRVHIGHVSVSSDKAPSADTRRVVYMESPGERGFAVRLDLGARIDITISPFLRRSPHVLYTNVVEPVLRWAFVERGYALVHGACMADGDNAFLITARTDTGKTTTVLKTLDAHREYSFVSDDLTLLRDDGTVLAYPKPLTISRHTLHAVNTPLLTPFERFNLFFQSRLHSKSGRWFGLMLTKYDLPMATTNAIVQWLVPPPKYHIQRLVPHAQVARSAKLAGMVVIERGESTHITLTHRQAVDTLLENCDDSYGFPPYDDIKEHLYFVEDGDDLRNEERRIVSSAMQHCPAVVMRSETRNWFVHIPDFIRNAGRPSAWAPANLNLEGSND
jgi:hypothetical protein